jgi:hypothetical protein
MNDKEFPIPPNTNLHRAIEMIAAEIAKDLINRSEMVASERAAPSNVTKSIDSDIKRQQQQVQ